MSLIEQGGLRLLRCLDPETAHGLALKALAAGLGPKGGPGGLPVRRSEEVARQLHGGLLNSLTPSHNKITKRADRNRLASTQPCAY